MKNPLVVEFLYAMSKKNKAERELELIRAACAPHQKQESINNMIDERTQLISCAFEVVVAESQEEIRKRQQDQYIQNIREFKAMALRRK